MTRDLYFKNRNAIDKEKNIEDEYDSNKYKIEEEKESPKDKDNEKEKKPTKKASKKEKKEIEKKQQKENKIKRTTARILSTCHLCLANGKIWEEQILSSAPNCVLIVPKQSFSPFFQNKEFCRNVPKAPSIANYHCRTLFKLTSS